MRIKKNKPKRLKGKPKKILEQKVLDRDNNTCQNCGAVFEIDVHHIVYKSRGGSDSVGNLITLCRVCHKLCHDYNIEILFGDTGWVFRKPESKLL